MNAPIEPTLADQRAALRRQLALQRQRIIDQIDPVDDDAGAAYPRSHTMRFLTQRSGLLLQVGGVLLGGRLIKSLSRGYAIAKVVRSLLAPR